MGSGVGGADDDRPECGSGADRPSAPHRDSARRTSAGQRSRQRASAHDHVVARDAGHRSAAHAGSRHAAECRSRSRRRRHIPRRAQGRDAAPGLRHDPAPARPRLFGPGQPDPRFQAPARNAPIRFERARHTRRRRRGRLRRSLIRRRDALVARRPLQHRPESVAAPGHRLSGSSRSDSAAPRRRAQPGDASGADPGEGHRSRVAPGVRRGHRLEAPDRARGRCRACD